MIGSQVDIENQHWRCSEILVICGQIKVWDVLLWTVFLKSLSDPCGKLALWVPCPPGLRACPVLRSWLSLIPCSHCISRLSSSPRKEWQWIICVQKQARALESGNSLQHAKHMLDGAKVHYYHRVLNGLVTKGMCPGAVCHEVGWCHWEREGRGWGQGIHTQDDFLM